MFECTACTLRLIRGLVRESVPTFRATRQPRPGISTSIPFRHQRRCQTTLASTGQTGSFNGKGVASKNSRGGAEGAQSPDGLPGMPPSERRALLEELRYLKDPLKLAEHVHYTLRCNKPEKALQLCRMASKDSTVIVSWNHCIDWHMGKGHVQRAMQIYNEMKKRAQYPDSYTAVLILRGLAAKQSMATEEAKRASVTRAVSIYNSLSSPTSRVRPNIIHTNATLTVCSEAQDLDALWGIMSKLPSTGKDAPDQRTYAIVLNALRHGAFPDSEEEGMYVERIAQRRNDAIQQGLKIWQKVVSRWAENDLVMDERLVVAMGRLLLFGSSLANWDKVFSLVKQTMNIERQVPVIGSAGRHTEHVPESEESRVTLEPQEGAEDYKDTPLERVFHPVNTPAPTDKSGSRGTTSVGYAQPGNSTINMLLVACTQLHTPKAATGYWDLLTKSPSEGGYGLKPDLPNFHAYLRLLKKNRASAKASVILSRDLPAAGIQPNSNTFRVAMAVCQRDNKNHDVLTNARRIVEVMEKMCPEPDPATLSRYLSLALASKKGPAIAAVLDHLDPMIHSLKSKLSFGLTTPKLGAAPSLERVADDRQETIYLFQAVVGAIDTLMHQNMVPSTEFKYWHGRRGLLIAFLGRQRNVLRDQRGRLEAAAESKEGERARQTSRRSSRDSDEEANEFWTE